MPHGEPATIYHAKLLDSNCRDSLKGGLPVYIMIPDDSVRAPEPLEDGMQPQLGGQLGGLVERYTIKHCGKCGLTETRRTRECRVDISRLVTVAEGYGYGCK